MHQFEIGKGIKLLLFKVVTLGMICKNEKVKVPYHVPFKNKILFFVIYQIQAG